jgi:RimK family alpha-L-glutamate ligase
VTGDFAFPPPGAGGRPRVGILARGDRWHVRSLAEALAARGCDAVPIEATRLAGRAGGAGGAGLAGARAPRAAGGAAIRIEDLDALVVRFIPAGSLDQIVFRIDALHLLADGGLPVVNPPRALERTVDKHWTTRLLHDAGVPTPRTVAAEDEEDAMAAFETMGDVVVKPLLGAGGRGICRVSDPDVAWRTFHALAAQRAVFYVQEFVPHGRSDLRFLVAGDRVVAAARRSGGGWKTNVAAGARAAAHRPAPAEEDLAIRACRAVGADYAGVDLIEAEDGRLLVVEVNGIPGFSALQRTTPVRIAGAIVDRVLARLRERSAAPVAS